MPKPFNTIYFKALEECSPGLYTSFWEAQEIMMASYNNGETSSPYRTGWIRQLRIGLVRSFLKEHRQGIRPRKSGKPNNFYTAMYELRSVLETYYRGNM